MKKYLYAVIFTALTLSSCGVTEKASLPTDTPITTTGSSTTSVSSVVTAAEEKAVTTVNESSEASVEVPTNITVYETSNTDTSDADNTNGSDIESDYTEPTTVSRSGIENPEMEAVIRNLADKNLDCMLNIYSLDMLPYDDSTPLDYSDPSTYLVKCTSDRFPTYNSLVEYTYSVYTDSCAYELLNKEFDSQKRYVDVDGELYCNRWLNGGIGYYTFWDNYDIRIDSLTDTSCDFTIIAEVVWPAEVPVLEDYPSSCTAVIEDGVWVLTSMFY